MTERERLPNRRRNETIDFVFDRVNYAATVGFFDDGRPGEVFAHGAKVGSMLDLLFDDACVTLSLLLQHGADPKKLAASMGRAGGDEPASIIGMLALSRRGQPTTYTPTTNDFDLRPSGASNISTT